VKNDGHFSRFTRKILKSCKILDDLDDIDTYILEEQSCEISSRSNLKWWNLRLFWTGHPNDSKNNNKMRSDMGSVLDLKVVSWTKKKHTGWAKK